MRILICFLVFTISSVIIAGNGSKSLSATKKVGTLFPGDILEIKVVNHEELSLDVSIDSDGTFNYPYCGLINVANKTTGDITKELSSKLEKKDFNDLQVSVFIKGFRYVYVFGEVEKPLAVELTSGMSLTVMQAISAAEGFTEKSDIENVSVVRHTNKGVRVFEYNVKKKINNTRRAPLFLRPGDSVIVRGIKPVSVLGEVKKAGVFYVRADVTMTLSTAIAMAGGFDKFADTDDVYLKRGNSTRSIDVDKILTTNTPDPVLMPGDTVFVTKTRW